MAGKVVPILYVGQTNGSQVQRYCSDLHCLLAMHQDKNMQRQNLGVSRW